MKGVLNWLESDIEAFLVFRVSLGYQRKTYEPQLRSFMSYVLESHTEASVLSKPLVMEYLEQQNANLHTKANTLRLFGLYLNSMGRKHMSCRKKCSEIQGQIYRTSFQIRN